MQLSKLLAHSGLCSRREAKDIIKSGKVTVNGVVQENPLTKVSEKDFVKLNGKRVRGLVEPRLWIYNKPKGVVTSHKDPEGRKTVFASLPKNLPRLVSVGRLDINSEGLLLLTNNGEVARFFELPINKFKRIYHVRVYGKVNAKELAKLKNGCIIDGIRYGNVLVHILESGHHNHWLSVSMTEGKNREIRRIMNHLGLEVSRLIRVSYGPYELGGLSKGNILEVDLYNVYNSRKIPGTKNQDGT